MAQIDLPSARAIAARSLRGLRAAMVLATGLLLAPCAGAQSFLGRGAPHALTIPGADEAARPPRRAEGPSPDGPEAGTPVPVSQAAVSLPQRPLPATGESLRLSGEEDALQWPVYVTAEQARERLRLRVGYLAAISVVPEASFLTAAVNDVVLGRTPIKAPGAVKVIEFDIPAGVLKAGYNAIAISAVQRHRVDCSLAATYELWTQIDPSWTGLVMPAGVETVRSLRDLPAVAPDARGLVPLRVVLRSKPGFSTFEKIIALVQRVALAGRYAHVSVEFGAPLQGPAGLNLVIGSADELRDLPGIDAAQAATGQALVFLPANAERAATLIVPGSGAAEIESAGGVLTASASRVAEGSPQGLRQLALARGLELGGGTTVPLSRFGVQNREFSGRLFRTGFDVTLPVDFIPADYGKAILSMAGGYAAGLETGAQVIVDVNGRNVASDTLPRAEGEVFRSLAMPLPLGRWRPGRNRIEITARLPSRADRTCEDSGVEAKRFLFLNDTTLTLPPLARALRLPELAATASGGLPYLRSAQRPRLVVPTPDRESMSAAATIAVRLALAAGRPIDFEIGNENALLRRAPTVVVAPARALDPEVLRAVGLDPEQIRRIWETRATALPSPAQPDATPGLSLDRLRNDVPPACALPASASRTALVMPRRARDADSDGETRDLVSSWSTAVRNRDSVGDMLSNATGRLGSAATETMAAATGWLTDQVREDPVTIGIGASLVVGQGMAGHDPDTAITVFTAPNGAALQASAICLSAPVVWNQLEGRVAALDANDGALTTFAARQGQIVETVPRTFENTRLVLAGWFSTNPNTFVLTLLAAAVLLGLSTQAMLRGVGRRSQPIPDARRDADGDDRESDR
ncbi:cellulose biosynthesis cyclic di-GMP-binding regulatory protein BcsB [Methylobacterium sp. WL119]|uniref:cellulose biosynthesis cyclic di-GMP-binding regulatory protein BcsB n=1 Tax=unclassified Methylobacterium TaxID=2615210 RepID=UPI0011CC0F22|nr:MULTISPECIES: cellulose biosynthesis cyclic di-GMP-binding regulatory protein BcsB [unclassified Methylobacterium]TXN41952.1 cellulose biosynthesis cyclic di-GMP-binding regulatory protein BcsB [Methylobacterium sp. WL93]TXN51971.1 cellulose biosynthesis cyclic di-GMP-binding regulatory protein BcsB [Methylobacterium sp. WL119]